MASTDYLSDIVTHLGGLLQGRISANRRKTGGGRGPVTQAPRKEDGGDVAGFLGRVKALIAKGGASATTTVHYIGLAKVRAHFGKRWPVLVDKVQGIARQAIERRLSDGDLHTPYRDEGYIVVFSRLPKEAAQLKCGLIALEISKRLFGKASADYLDILSIGVDAGGIVRSEAVSVRDVVDRMARRKSAMASSREVEVPGGRRAQRSPGAVRHLPAVRSTPSPTGAAMASLGPDGGGTKEAKPSPPESLQFVYRPMWYVKRKVISAYLCIPARVDSSGEILFAGAAMPLTHASPENATHDMFTLRKVLGDFRELLSAERKLVLVAPVHYITISEPGSRRTYLEMCSRIPEAMRSLLVFELIGLPEDLPTTPMVRAVSAFKPFSRAILVRRCLESSDFAKLREIGVYGTGVEISNYPAPEKEIIRGMDKLNAAASGLATYVHGLRSLSLISAAAGAGFVYIDGDPVMSFTEVPNNISPFNIEDLYKPLIYQRLPA